MIMKLDEQIRVTKKRERGKSMFVRTTLGRKKFAVALSAGKIPRDMVYNIIRGGVALPSLL